LQIDNSAKVLRVAGRELREGDVITIDGATGEVMAGAVPTLQPELVGDFGTLMEWADGSRRMKVRANAETPLDAQTARDFGAEGIGLCRTEHMFFDASRITAVRQMILAEDEKRPPRCARQAAARAAQGFCRDIRGDGRASRHHSPARPASARIPADAGRPILPRLPRPRA
jgi:phosphoenolpyruvate synthase/pyruvate phosphate dikinase